MAIVITGMYQAGKTPVAPSRNRKPRSSGTPMPRASWKSDRDAGKARKAKNSAKARWIDRVSVLLKTPTPTMKGSGEAIHSWNSDQTSAVPEIRYATGLAGLRPPVSDEATRSCSDSWREVAASTSTLSISRGRSSSRLSE